MGGKGSGGARVGTGPKPKDKTAQWLGGNAGKRGKASAAKPPALPPVDEFDAPNDLTTDERNVWLELAPHGFQARTLTRATSYAFRLLCRNIVLERVLSADAERRGAADHRGLIQRVDAELVRFCLSPMGKPLVAEQPQTKDEWAEFDDKPTAVN